mgnify:CR=1 FL=1
MNLKYGLPRNLLGWVDANRARLKPPVNNAALYPDGNYIINMVGGGNTRTDFHHNPTEEIFHQIKGTAYIEIWDRGKFDRVDLREGDVWLMEANLHHSPQRPDPNGLCFLVELRRPKGVLDSFNWYCPRCATLVWGSSVELQDLVADLPRTFEVFYALNDTERTCRHCGTVHPGRDYAAWHAIRTANP